MEYLGEIANEPGAISKLCDRDRFAGRPSGIRRTPARSPQRRQTLWPTCDAYLERLFQAIARPRSTSRVIIRCSIGQSLGEAGDGEVRRRGVIDDRRNDAGRQEGEGSEQADVPFTLGFTLGNPGEDAMRPSLMSSTHPRALAIAERPGFRASSPV